MRPSQILKKDDKVAAFIEKVNSGAYAFDIVAHDKEILKLITERLTANLELTEAGNIKRLIRATAQNSAYHSRVTAIIYRAHSKLSRINRTLEPLRRHIWFTYRKDLREAGCTTERDMDNLIHVVLKDAFTLRDQLVAFLERAEYALEDFVVSENSVSKAERLLQDRLRETKG